MHVLYNFLFVCLFEYTDCVLTVYCTDRWRNWDTDCNLHELQSKQSDECIVGPLWVAVCLNIYFEAPLFKIWLSFGKNNLEYTEQDIRARFQVTVQDDTESTKVVSPHMLALMDSCVFALTRSGSQGPEDEK